jgi:hypothetical protein
MSVSSRYIQLNGQFLCSSCGTAAQLKSKPVCHACRDHLVGDWYVPVYIKLFVLYPLTCCAQHGGQWQQLPRQVLQLLQVSYLACAQRCLSGEQSALVSKMQEISSGGLQ